MKTDILRVDIAPQGVETPAPLADCWSGQVLWIQRAASVPPQVPSLDQKSFHVCTTSTVGDENEPPRVDTVPQGVETPLSFWLIVYFSWGSWSQRAARVAPRDNVEVRPRPGMITYHLLIRDPSIHLLTLTARGRKRTSPGRYRHTRCGSPNPTGSMLIFLGAHGSSARRELPVATTARYRHTRGRYGPAPVL